MGNPFDRISNTQANFDFNNAKLGKIVEQNAKEMAAFQKATGIDLSSDSIFTVNDSAEIKSAEKKAARQQMLSSLLTMAPAVMESVSSLATMFGGIKQLSSAKGSVGDLKSQLNQLNENKATIEKNIGSCNSDISKSDIETPKLEKKRADKNSEALNQQKISDGAPGTKTAELTKEITGLKSEVITLNGNVSSAQSELRAAEALPSTDLERANKINVANSKINSLNKQIEQKEKEIDLKNKELEQLKDNARTAKQKALDEMYKLDEQIGEYKNLKNSASKNKNEEETKLRNVNAQLSEVTRQIETEELAAKNKKNKKNKE